MLRKTLCCLLCCIAIMCLPATAVFAAGGGPVSAQPTALSFDFSGAEPPVTGGSLELYKVAAWDETAQHLDWCEDFASAGASFDALDSEETALALSVYAITAQLVPMTVKIGADGTATVEDLAYGVYLVRQQIPFEGYTCIKPALISVPCHVDGAWVYKVTAMPKLSPLETETTTTTEPIETTKPPPELPPTGQVNWPVPMLVLVGCFLILLGICLRKDKNHEA